ncbi:MAG TPA: hypothetical protein VK001_01970 [Geminicoccaceae bacterium]|jgi:hypothetical protein|nr:hypothetical protein [Geminicoccaceae bacterium]
MERNIHDTAVIDLGTASLATRGQDIVAEPESDGYRLFGMLEA